MSEEDDSSSELENEPGGPNIYKKVLRAVFCFRLMIFVTFSFNSKASKFLHFATSVGLVSFFSFGEPFF